jgi:hypothetical protein
MDNCSIEVSPLYNILSVIWNVLVIRDVFRVIQNIKFPAKFLAGKLEYM